MAKSPPQDVKPLDSEWLKILYAEAWNQYKHEDDLGQARTNFFFGIQAALIGIIAATTPNLLGIGTVVFLGHVLQVGLLIVGFLCLITGILCLIATANWQYVTDAGGAYVKFRLIQLVGIEKLAGIEKIGLATQEWIWTNAEHTPGRYYPFVEFDSLKKYSIRPIDEGSGWSSMKRVIAGMQVFWGIIAILGIGAIVVAGILFFR